MANELVSLADIYKQLQAAGETLVPLEDAFRIVQETVAVYEADRAKSAAVIEEQAAQIVALESKVASLTPDVTMVVGSEGVLSRFAPALTWCSNPNTWRQAGWANAKANIGSMVGSQSTHYHPFGNNVAWQWDGTGTISPAPNNLYGETTSGGTMAKPAPNSFVGSLRAMREVDAGGPLHIKIFMAEWFMKHQVQMDGSCANLTYADRFNAEKGRVKQPSLPQWKALVTATCRIAFAAPYNVRYVSVWNELKQFWDNVKGRYDMTYNAGSETTPMGFVYFYEQTVQAILDAAAALGIAESEIKVGGPYPPLRARGKADGSVVPIGHALRDRPWGSADRHSVAAVETFLTEVKNRKLKLDFISVDGADGNKDGVYPAADDFVNGQRWHDWHAWIRAELAERGLDPTLPIIWDEWYRKPVVNPPAGTQAESQAYWTALKADTFCTMVLDGVMWPMSWGPAPIEGDGDCGSMLTDTSLASGGAVAPFGELCQFFKQHFGPGVTVYPLLASDGSVGGLTSKDMALLVNKTATPRRVAMGGGMALVDAYEWRGVMR
jgi:hypothetical protein